ncbi:MAG: hypothetical protein ACUVWX_09935 [Kiritimatiellia bacterium]
MKIFYALQIADFRQRQNLAFLLWVAMAVIGGASRSEEISAERIRKAAWAAASYLAAACGEDGKFVYRAGLDSEFQERKDYNVLRHAGAVYALALYTKQLGSEPAMRAALGRAVVWLKGTIKAVPGQTNLLAVWSDPPEQGVEGVPVAKLGGTGLGLLALLTVEDTTPGTTSYDVLVQLGRFLVFLQRTDGSFVTRYLPDRGADDEAPRSLYYPGEAIMALLALYEKDKAPLWFECATRGLGYLLRDRTALAESDPDHWALLAAAKWLATSPPELSALAPQEVIERSATICTAILSQVAIVPPGSILRGCFTGDGRTCPTATRIEGLAAIYSFLPTEHEALRRRIRFACKEGISFLLRAQETRKGAIPLAIRKLADTHPLSSVTFNRRAGEVRVDYVQHGLCAMLNFLKLGEGETGEAIR